MSTLFSTRELVFFVPGVPVTGGSKKSFVIHQKGCPAGRKKWGKGPCNCHPHAVVSEAAGESNKIWRYAVKTAGLHALRDLGGEIFSGPLSVELSFYLPRPRGHYGAAGYLLSRAPLTPATRPDVLKLARTVEDALSKIVWNDDAQIVRERLSKDYTTRNQAPGVNIVIEEIS